MGSTGRPVEPEVADDRVDVAVGGEGPEVAQGLDLDDQVVAGGAHLQPEEGQAFALVEPAGDPEVEQGHRAVGLDHQVPAVEVAVEHAVEQGALEEGDQGGAEHRRGVDAGRAHPDGVAPGEPVQVLHDQHPPGHQLRMGPGHDHGPLAGTGEHLGDVEHVLGLEPEVELLDDGLGEQLDQGRRIGQGGDRDATHQKGGDPRHGGDVEPDQGGDVPAAGP